MTKFWYSVAIMFVLALSLLAFGQEEKVNGLISFDDLETECRYDRATEAFIDLNSDNSIHFEGYFPAENTDARLEYMYSKTENRIILDIYTREVEELTDYRDNCLASVVYSADTDKLDSGSYLIKIQHEGKTVDEKVIKVS